METLTNRFIDMLADKEGDAAVYAEVAAMVLSAPATPETDGLLAWMYHEGIGVDTDLDKAFGLAEKAAFGGNDPLGYFLLGYMCDCAETPDQAGGGSRQKYDSYDAPRFFEQCAGIDSVWRGQAVMWLADYYFDMAAGGDPDVAVEYLESIAQSNHAAAARLSDYFWDLVMPEYIEDEEWLSKLFRWTSVAAEDDPENYSFRLGWLYADGLGCEKNYDEAIGCFTLACDHGDARGAEAAAQCYREIIEQNPSLPEATKADYEDLAVKWDEIADKMYSRQNPDTE